MIAGCTSGERATDAEDPPPATPSVSISGGTVAEGDSGARTLDFGVQLSAPGSGTVSVSFATAGISASPGNDFEAASGTLTFAAGETSQTITVNVLGDTLFEPDERFEVDLTNPVNAVLSTPTAVGTITNDDAVPSMSLSDATVVEGDSGTRTLDFQATLSAPSGVVATADFSTADATATAGDDYVAANGSLSFPAGTTARTISVTVAGDIDFEPDEEFGLSLANPVNANLVAATATGTIQNDDAPPPNTPVVQIQDATIDEQDAGSTSLSFDVQLSQISADDVSVDYTTADLTAQSPSDYDAAAGTVDFPAGTSLQTVEITVHGDVLVESDEQFRVNLSSPVNAVLGNNFAIGTIVDDDGPGSQPGLDTRPSNTTCIAPQRQTGGAGIVVPDAFPSLPSINLPTKIIMEPVADPRWFVLQKTGELRTFDPDSATAMPVYIDLSAVVRTNSEGGLLGLAFHPDYPATPEIFLSYTRNHTNPAMRSVVSRFILDDVASPGAGTVEQVIIEIDQDFDNHNGGDIAFGPDGFLYLGLGDGGSGGDPNNRAQDPRHMLGSFLRLDVLGPGADPYDIPPDNPFAGNPECSPGLNPSDCPEIYATGMRNPWRWSFDPDTGQLWAADVGQDNREEIDLIELGGNYGWNCFEGTGNLFVPGCPSTGFVPPVSEYPHTDGNGSITGGYVYRGTAIPALAGRYVFADFLSGRIWALLSDGQGGYTNDELIDTSHGITSFGVDQSGELYYTDINTGRIHKIEPGGGGSGDNIPTLLSDSGCVDPGDVTQPYSGLVPYDLNAPFWSDGADKERWIGIPDGTTISIDGNDDWDFPAGTVIVKNFRLNGNLIETRHLMRHPDGVWAGYTYEWDLLQTEATRVQGGKTVLIDGQNWIFPSEGECMSCHTGAAGFSLGPETAQLNRDFTYPSTQRTANQLETLDHIMMFSSPLPGPVQDLPALTDPADTGAPLGDRARAYLHTNCAQCHRPGGPTPSSMDLRYDTLLSDTNACDALPQEGDLGIVNARIIAPGDSLRSVLIARVGLRDANGMPPLASNIVDAAGVSLLTSWVDGLNDCN